MMIRTMPLKHAIDDLYHSRRVDDYFSVSNICNYSE